MDTEIRPKPQGNLFGKPDPIVIENGEYKVEKPMRILGIDPGSAGSIAVIDFNATSVHKMPETPKDLLELLKSLKTDNCLCILERVGGLPGMGGSPMFNFGKGFGYIEMALIATEITTFDITPQKWQKEFQIGTTKSKVGSTKWKGLLKAKAQQIFPTIKMTLWAADALLLAEYGRRNYLK